MTFNPVDFYNDVTDGGKTREFSGNEPVFTVADGHYPVTVITISRPYARGASQFAPKGSLRTYIQCLIDGTDTYLRSQGIEPPDHQEVGWYTFAASVNFPLKPNHPPTVNADGTTASWVSDPAEIKRWAKSLTPMMTSPDGQFQTFFGVFAELKCVDEDPKTKLPVVLYADAIGARGYLTVQYNAEKNRSYGGKLRNVSLPRSMAVTEKPDDNWLLNNKHLVLSVRDWPKNTGGGDGGGTETKRPLAQSQVAFAAAIIGRNGALANQPGLEIVRQALEKAAMLDNAPENRFSALKFEATANLVLITAAQEMAKVGIAMPPLNTTEEWAVDVQTAYAQVIDSTFEAAPDSGGGMV